MWVYLICSFPLGFGQFHLFNVCIAFARRFPLRVCSLLFYFLTHQSRAQPREIMTEVLKALQELNVCWKKIGFYNMKCRWIAGTPGQHEGMVDNTSYSSHYYRDDSTIIENDAVPKSNVVKFEVQVMFFKSHLIIDSMHLDKQEILML